ncbi:LysR family transcriptional regulator [Clostridium sp. AF19-22AC]|jgi:DNA-binding transcriptional LysR family regulator|uniref:DNA-binding transcriptional LysR family regulator n=1 Tax=Faecalicatena orotica TaxID=1544 RepID=A0A2Y9CA81_9FIRM|nr:MULTISPECIES: LysR family transcriptional regulator [Clostridia]PWJ28684.1 DNA-binding transcriptional LysR family regulator [Faecalicatena orotica]RHR31209.1 LysR family transcriptional regulator [Clostridium sp. AF19-22AC]SSA56506.1 DNA-binding transcriptional regulator, LysR family [Faecalicatena orotica]
MEIRVLRYFIEIAREGNMSRAAETLHVSQPTLSKQMKELEKELGKKLFKRGSTTLTLTDEGMLLRKRAEDILEMVDKTTDEFKALDNIMGGDVQIGCAESYLIKYLARAIGQLKADYPLLRYHLSSGNTEQVTEKLDKGLLDFAVIAEPPSLSKYNYIEIPGSDVWGLLMKRDNPLTKKKTIVVDDLLGLDLICSDQAIKVDIPRWCGEKVDMLNFTGTTNLFYNGSVFVKEGLGSMLTFDRLADTGADSGLCFRPLSPALETKMYVIWKKYQVFTPIANLLINELKNILPE